MVRSTTHRVALASVLLALLAHGVSADEPRCAQPQPVVDSTYKPGQVWSYKTRPGEGSSTITVLRVESTPKLGVIVHVRIDGFQFKKCDRGPGPSTMEHAPFAKAAIDKGISAQGPDFTTTMRSWLISSVVNRKWLGDARFRLSVSSLLAVFSASGDTTPLAGPAGCGVGKGSPARRPRTAIDDSSRCPGSAPW